ncbi:MAG: hypothetical protein AAFP17_03255 [Pseudomonadota bacterium]
MTTLPAFARMVFKSPLVGTASFVMSLPFVLPLALTLYVAAQPEVAAMLAAADAEVVSLGLAAAEAMGAKDLAIPAWVAPVSWLLLLPGIVIYGFAAQRLAMRLAGTARRPNGIGQLARNFAEWTLIIALLQGLALVLIVGGIAAAAVSIGEVSRFLGLHRLPELTVLLGREYTEFGRPFWSAYQFVPMLVVGAMGLFFVFGGRYMALLSAYLEGNLRGGLGAGAASGFCALLFGYALYGVLAGGLWGYNIAAAELGLPVMSIALGHVLALHVALFWNWMAAASAFGARREVERCVEDMAHGMASEGHVVMGAMRNAPVDEENDVLARQLKAWEARNAA